MAEGTLNGGQVVQAIKGHIMEWLLNVVMKLIRWWPSKTKRGRKSD